MKVGKASFGNKKKNFRIKDGSNVYRILPALGMLADSGTWYVYNRVEWGYKDSDGIHRPFLDCRELDFESDKDEDGNFLVKVESPAHLRREGFKNRKLEVVELLKKDRTNVGLLEELKDLNDDCKRYNLDAKYYLNAVNLQGEIGMLKVGATHFKALKAKRDKIMETKGEDVLSINGGYFMDFSRTNETGKIQDYVFEVTPYTENVEVGGETYQKVKKHDMDEPFINRLGGEARELAGMFREVTAEQVQRMVDEGIPAIEEFLGRAKSKDNKPTSSGKIAEEKVSSRAETVVEEKTTSVKETTASKSEEAEVVSEPTMSEDEFLKSIGAV